MIRNTVTTFEVPSQEERKQFVGLEKSLEVHEATIASLACMNSVRVGNANAKQGASAEQGPIAFPFTIAAWNLERCLFPLESAEKIRATGAPLVLLSEMDEGMARTAQGDPTAEIARELGMNYAYAVEFLELGLGSEIERSFCKEDFNAKGFHGNALIASAPLKDAFLVRLPGSGRCFLLGDDEPRIGGRCAVGAIVETETGPLVAVSVHLESVADSAYRERQVAALIDAVEAYAPGLPIIIGGDLNTGNHTGGDFEAETLFATATARGFSRHGGPLGEMSVRASLLTPAQKYPMKLDWFLTRGLAVEESRLVSSLTQEGKPLSDHDMIVCTITGLL